MRTIFKCCAPAQDPMFGINQGFIVDRLTRENWKPRAVCRTDGEVVYYTYVVRGKLWDGEKKKWVYAMTAYPFPRKGQVNGHRAHIPTGSTEGGCLGELDKVFTQQPRRDNRTDGTGVGRNRSIPANVGMPADLPKNRTGIEAGATADAVE